MAERTEPADEAPAGRGRRLRGALSIDRWARWTRRLTSVAAAIAVATAIVAAFAAFRALGTLPAVVVSAACAVPALVALMLRARSIWLVESVPNLLTELRTVADRNDEAAASAEAAGDAAPEREERRRAADALRAQADEVQALVTGGKRRSIRGMYRVFKLLRSPANEATKLAKKHLGDRAAASLSTTTGAASRLAGFAPLMWLAGLGTVAAAVVAAVLLIVGTF